MKLHLVDGTFELFRAHFGAPGRLSSAGMEIGATRGILRSLLGLVTHDGATHVAVAFDKVIESFRNQMFAGYKTGEGLEPLLLAQFPLAEEASRALGMVTWPLVEFEADDGMAAGAARWAADTEQVVLCSPDKDLMQCVVDDRVVVWDRIRKKIYDYNGVVEKFGIPPASIPDYLALVGDTADGIPGIPRWGAKSTAVALSHYGRLSEIPDKASDWAVKVRGAASLADNLAAQRDDANLYRELAVLRTDVPLPQTSIDELEWRGADRGLMEALCDKLEYPDFLERVPRWR